LPPPQFFDAAQAAPAPPRAKRHPTGPNRVARRRRERAGAPTTPSATSLSHLQRRAILRHRVQVDKPVGAFSHIAQRRVEQGGEAGGLDSAS